MKLHDLINTDELRNEIRDGYVTERFHPQFPELAILNYTDQAQFDNRWNEITRQTRGLIYNRETGEIVARPFRKFYNYGDVANTGELDPDAPIRSVHNKWDGSLGIRYRKPDGKYAIATRGSFESEQAKHATALLESQPESLPVVMAGETDLFEIIYPANRIVLDYGLEDRLVWLGSVENETGVFQPVGESGAPAKTLREVAALPQRANAEGWVVWLDEFRAVKFKQDDYLALHRVISSLTVKEIWRQLRSATIDEFIIALPDEFHSWARDERYGLEKAFNEVLAEVSDIHSRLLRENLPDRKSQALWIAKEAPDKYRGFLFGLLDGRDISDPVWRTLEPKNSVPV